MSKMKLLSFVQLATLVAYVSIATVQATSHHIGFFVSIVR